MLIKCPECGKEVSDKSKQCIHCGYPLVNNDNNKSICKIKNIEFDLSQELQMIIDNIAMAHVIRSLRVKCNMALNDAKRLYDIINETKQIPESFQCDILENSVQPNIPKCPICGSNNIQKITTATRALKTAVFGIAGAVDDAGKTYKCNNCGSKF